MSFISPRLLLVLIVGAAATGCATAPSPAGWPVDVRADPVPFSEGPAPPAEGATIGSLRFRAGFHLTADRSEFGGFSGLAISADGRRLCAVSDRGWWLGAELVHDAGGTLEALGKGRMGPLLDDDGRPVEGRDRRDAEEIVALPDGGSLVTFEAHHRVHLYEGSPPSGRPRVLPSPVGLAGFPENHGMEAAALVGRNGPAGSGPDPAAERAARRPRLLVFSEEVPEEGGAIAAWQAEFPGPGGGLEWQRLSLRSTGAFQPTGAATLPSGDVLLLERSYSPEDGTRVRLSRIAGAAVAAGVTLVPEELVRLEPPLTLDNMEAVAVRPGPAGETLIYLLSDDNYSADQRTLLMQYELLPAD